MILRETTKEKIQKATKCSPMCNGFKQMVDIIKELDYEVTGLQAITQAQEDKVEALKDRNREEREETTRYWERLSRLDLMG